VNEIDLEGNVLRLQNLQAKKETREDVKPKEKQPANQQVTAEALKVVNVNKPNEVSEKGPTEPKNVAIEDNGVPEPFKVCLPSNPTVQN